VFARIDMSAHGKSGIATLAYQEKIRRPETGVNHKRAPPSPPAAEHWPLCVAVSLAVQAVR
jgi:hypothetical protein